MIVYDTPRIVRLSEAGDKSPQPIYIEDGNNKIIYQPLYMSGNDFSGFYLPVVNGTPTYPVSTNYVFVPTSLIIDKVESWLRDDGLRIKDVIRRNYKIYETTTILIDKPIHYSDTIFEKELIDIGIDIREFIDYNIPEDGTDDLYPSIVITNSYCGLSSLTLSAKLIRIICMNGIMYDRDVAITFKSKHVRDEYTFEIIIEDQLEAILSNINSYIIEIQLLNREIDFETAIRILNTANKYNIGKRYIENIKEKVVEKLFEIRNRVSLYIIWNLITYMIDRSKSIHNIPMRERTIYLSMFKALKELTS